MKVLNMDTKSGITPPAARINGCNYTRSDIVTMFALTMLGAGIVIGLLIAHWNPQ